MAAHEIYMLFSAAMIVSIFIFGVTTISTLKSEQEEQISKILDRFLILERRTSQDLTLKTDPIYKLLSYETGEIKRVIIELNKKIEDLSEKTDQCYSELSYLINKGANDENHGIDTYELTILRHDSNQRIELPPIHLAQGESLSISKDSRVKYTFDN